MCGSWHQWSAVAVLTQQSCTATSARRTVSFSTAIAIEVAVRTVSFSTAIAVLNVCPHLLVTVVMAQLMMQEQMEEQTQEQLRQDRR
jgi:hypothetical protein